MNDFTAKAKRLFDSYPEVIRFYFTSDGQAFEKDNPAVNHALKLTDKTITEVFKPGMSEADIKQFKQDEALQAAVDLEATYKRIFPHLAKGIAENTRKKQGY